jgi:CBS domain-containing protein
MKHQLKVSDVMTREVVTVTEDTPFKRLAALLAEHRISAVPVLNQYGGVVGVVSETDLLRKEEFQRSRPVPWRARWWRHRARAKAAAVDAGKLMTHPAVTIESGSTINEAARLMASHEITRLVVTDGDELAGIVTRSDLLSAFLVPDEQLLDRVRRDVVEHALWQDPFAVEATVTDGVVTLTGELEHRSMAAIAEKLTREIDGVVDVHNRLAWAFDDTVPAPGSTGNPVPRQP